MNLNQLSQLSRFSICWVVVTFSAVHLAYANYSPAELNQTLENQYPDGNFLPLKFGDGQDPFFFLGANDSLYVASVGCGVATEMFCQIESVTPIMQVKNPQYFNGLYEMLPNQSEFEEEYQFVTVSENDVELWRFKRSSEDGTRLNLIDQFSIDSPGKINGIQYISGQTYLVYGDSGLLQELLIDSIGIEQIQTFEVNTALSITNVDEAWVTTSDGKVFARENTMEPVFESTFEVCITGSNTELLFGCDGLLIWMQSENPDNWIEYDLGDETIYSAYSDFFPTGLSAVYRENLGTIKNFHLHDTPTRIKSIKQIISGDTNDIAITESFTMPQPPSGFEIEVQFGDDQKNHQFSINRHVFGWGKLLPLLELSSDPQLHKSNIAQEKCGSVSYQPKVIVGMKHDTVSVALWQVQVACKPCYFTSGICTYLEPSKVTYEYPWNHDSGNNRVVVQAGEDRFYIKFDPEPSSLHPERTSKSEKNVQLFDSKGRKLPKKTFPMLIRY